MNYQPPVNDAPVSNQHQHSTPMKHSQDTHKRKDEAVISAKGGARVRDGHLWIYRSDVASRPKVESGSVVRVSDNRGRFLAWAHYGAESEITLRLLSKD